MADETKKTRRTPQELRDLAPSFELDREEVPVTIGGGSYVLVELDGAGRDKYLNDVARRLKPMGDKQTVRDFDNLQSNLLAKCLFQIDGDERKGVEAKTIQKWPARVVGELFDLAKELSALGDEDEDGDEGNDD